MNNMRQKDSGAEGQEAQIARILVVEDNYDAATILETLLRIKGYDVCVTQRGLQGVAAGLTYRPHIAIVDLGLPDIDGWEVARRLRDGLGNSRPVLIALTGYGSDEHRAKSTSAGFDHHLLKSMASDELLNLIRQAANSKTGSRQ